MRRHGFRDDQWERIEGLLPRRVGHVGVTTADSRLFVEAVLYRRRTGLPWRDLLERFGCCKNIRRHSRWSATRMWGQPFKHLTAIHLAATAIWFS